MVKRQRWRNPAMTCGSWPSASRDLASLARRSGDVAGDLGGDFRGIERMGIEPDAAEALADFRAVEVRQGDAVRDGIGEAFVLAAGAGELGVEVDAVADVANDEERRAAFIGGQGGDVAAPWWKARSRALSKARVPRLPWPVLVAVGLASSSGEGVDGEALLGFVDEAPGFVEVDVIGGGGAVRVDAGDGAVEDVAVLRGIGRGGVGARDADDVAEFGEEHLVVRPLGGTGGFPAGDEGGDLLGGGFGHGVGSGKREWIPTVSRRGGKASENQG
jgi:hypothetical protein